MKPFKNVLILAVLTAGIIVFWLAPGVNKGAHDSYVRYYEDTDEKVVTYAPQEFVLASVTYDSVPQTKSKVYKKEVIEPMKSKEIKAEMFSRAIHFEPMEETDSLLQLVQNQDSLAAIQ